MTRAIVNSIGTAIGVGFALAVLSVADFGSDAMLGTICIAYIFQPFADMWIDRRYD